MWILGAPGQPRALAAHPRLQLKPTGGAETAQHGLSALPGSGSQSNGVHAMVAAWRTQCAPGRPGRESWKSGLRSARPPPATPLPPRRKSKRDPAPEAHGDQQVQGNLPDPPFLLVAQSLFMRPAARMFNKRCIFPPLLCVCTHAWLLSGPFSSSLLPS